MYIKCVAKLRLLFDPTVVYMTEEEEEGFNLICQSLLFLFG